MAAVTPSTLAPPRPRLRSLRAALGFLVFLSLCVATLSGDWSGFFSRQAAHDMFVFFASFFPPAGGAGFLRRVAFASLETFAISLVGTVLAAIGGIALALPAAGRVGRPAQVLARFVANALRAVPELVWAAMIVIAAGLGPLAGTLALAVHTTGVLARLFAEAMQNVDAEPYAALRHNGASAAAAFWYATLPQILPQLTSYSLYRWENNIRAAAVLGVVGAGGLGQMLYFHLSLFQVREAATVLMAMIVLVAMVDVASHRTRMAMTR